MHIENGNFIISCGADGGDIAVRDRLSGQEWRLDGGGAVFSGDRDSDAAHFTYAPLKPAGVRKDGQGELRVSYAGDWRGTAVALEMRYCLRDDYIEIILPGGVPELVQAVSLPGAFTADGARYLLPIMQGMYWDGRGGDFDWELPEASHGGFSMPMFGLLGESGGLLAVAETDNDVLWRVGKRNGRPFAMNLQRASLGRMGYDRILRLYPTAPSVTAIAKRYRRRVIGRGRFESWESKLESRPALDRLFGTLFAFTGYCRDDIDYARECEKLKEAGFKKAHLFPVRFNAYTDGFLMGGFPPVSQDADAVRKIKELGYDAAPWSWICEAIDDGSEEIRKRYRIYHDGKTRTTWEIDEYKWHKICNSTLPGYQAGALTGVCADLTWDHFDVITCACNHECYSADHPGHAGRPMGRAEDREWIRKLLVEARAGGERPISSESFNDAYSLEYDIGSVLAWPQYGPWDFWPVPLTMLVYHDSMIHTWWEAHAYNDGRFGRDRAKYQYGGGRPRLMSAMDALYGNPPFVFPFGAQYGWTGNGKETFLYRYRQEDALTRLSLGLALEVAALHERIGKLEMLDFEFVTEDGYVQRTAFESGVSVYANFGPALYYIPGVGTIESESWKAIGI